MAFANDMDELYGALSTNDNEEAQENKVPVYTRAELAEISPNDMIIYDMKNEQLLHDHTYALQTSMSICEHIAVAAYKVAEYVPDLHDNKYAEFWKEQVSIITVKTLHYKTFFRKLFE